MAQALIETEIDLTELEALHRAKWTATTREAYLKSNPENFAGEDGSFPIKDGSDVNDAYRLAGHAPNPDAVRSKIKSIAKRLGLEGSLPDTAKEEDGKKDDGERAMQSTEEETRAISADHESMTGTHTHAHPALGAQGDDNTHSHEHTHDNDADHGHTHADVTQERAQTHDTTPPSAIQASDRHVMSLPFVRIDATKREVWGQATAEIPDSYGTIFGYYPEAWKTWRGNIREQHDPKKAVGKRVELDCNDQERAIYVGSRVSRGAQDTWLKVEDDVLAGYSASIIPDPEFGNDIRKWPRKEYKGKEYPYLPRYTVAELSLVDNPACPGCDIAIVRADGFVTDVLDLTEDEPVVEQNQETQDRVGARVGKNTKDAMHTSIGHTLHAAVSQMQNCGCPACAGAMKTIDPDGDGDIDLGGYDDPDGDAGSLNKPAGDDMARVVTELIEHSLQPVYARLQGIAGTLARSNANAAPMNIDQLITSSITRAFESFESRISDIPSNSNLYEVRAELSAVKGQVDRIAEQPMPGGPILNASVMPRPPIEKSLATDPMPQQQTDRSYGAVYEAIQEMSRRGVLDTPDKQTEAMAAALAAQRSRR